MDVRMDYQKTKDIVKDEGWDGFVKHINSYFPNFDLYSCSQDWFDDPKYICKLRGSNSDVIIGWHGYHEY